MPTYPSVLISTTIVPFSNDYCLNSHLISLVLILYISNHFLHNILDSVFKLQTNTCHFLINLLLLLLIMLIIKLKFFTMIYDVIEDLRKLHHITFYLNTFFHLFFWPGENNERMEWLNILASE